MSSSTNSKRRTMKVAQAVVVAVIFCMVYHVAVHGVETLPNATMNNIGNGGDYLN